MHTHSPGARRSALRDLPTLALIVVFGGVWAAALALPGDLGWLAVVLLIPALTLHSSLTHEILHGHPFGHAGAETVLGLWQPGLAIPYLRFKRLHLAHHRDAALTDPYDDPESAYLDPGVWARLPRVVRGILRINNTLAGRILLGPAIGTYLFWRDDLRAIRAGAPHVLRDWLAHLPGVALTLVLVALSALPLWAYLLACYGALSVLKIRTFLEHQAHLRVSGRTVIIEDRGPLAFLFLNNNLHLVHHMHPAVPWYRLPALYAARREAYVARNHGYVYRSYAQVFARYLWRAKEPVAHPHWREAPICAIKGHDTASS
ncbi:fatty acid desaturase [Sulfitobacter albidus]|uniref:Fatty acid desaturase n=1 Tax=Sulfitobacter albidus TaxID=2829501 RepID=A0A975PL13_9RHOB|nr:fatty acid desaturase [Sulfitobacter albidus]QUJ75243.1 fatty acid desaturase [Sulfitobacter albidus]